MRKYHSKRGKRSYRARRTYKKRSRRGSKLIYKRIAKLEKIAIKERPCKRIAFSDAGVASTNEAFSPLGILSTTNPMLVLLNPLVRGTALQERLADYAYFSKIQFKLMAQGGTSITNQRYINWMLIVQNEPEGVALTAAQFLNDYFGKTAPPPNAVPDLTNNDIRKDYRVLSKGKFHLIPQFGTQQAQSMTTINWYSKKHVRTSYVRANTGSISDIDSGAIYIVAWTDSPVTTTGIQLFLEGNVWFRDQV